jgi:carnitine O-acetyltransferase
LEEPVELVFTTNKETRGYVSEAQKVAQELIDSTESCLLQTDIYGSRFMKEVAATSPDAYIQMALQLTWFRLYKQPTAVYETASTRLFKFGRTETGRSLSTASLEFVKSFDNDDILYDTKRELFRKAVSTQSGYMKEASVGKGIDRHMLGLRAMIKPDEANEVSTLVILGNFVQ